jgi:hypothetical protein
MRLLNVQDFITCREHGNNKNIDMICSAYESFLETKSSSGTPNPKIFESQIIYKSVGATKPKGLNRIAKFS